MNSKSYTLSCLLGLIIGYSIAYYKLHSSAIEYHGPNSDEIKRWVWFDSNENKYYKFKTIPFVCPPTLSGCVKV